MEEKCDSRPGPVMLYACSCGSNVGQLANEGARQSALSGQGKMACLPGISVRMETSLKAAQGARTIVMVDGCGMSCGRKILESAGFKVDQQVVVTELGIAKTTDLNLRPGEVEKVKAAIAALISAPP